MHAARRSKPRRPIDRRTLASAICTPMRITLSSSLPFNSRERAREPVLYATHHRAVTLIKGAFHAIGRASPERVRFPRTVGPGFLRPRFCAHFLADYRETLCRARHPTLALWIGRFVVCFFLCSSFRALPRHIPRNSNEGVLPRRFPRRLV